MEKPTFSIEYCGVKEEFGEDIKFNVEDLHCSTNIKKETPMELDEESEKSVAPKDHYDIKREVMESKEFNCEDLQYLVDVKEDATDELDIESKVHKSQVCGSFQCEVCNENFTCNTQLVKHSRIHSIDLIAKLKERLKIHLSASTGNKPYPCELGDYKSAQKGSLEENVVFQCKVCNEKFTCNTQLVKHSRIHSMDLMAKLNRLKTQFSVCSGDKPHPCELGDYKSAQKRSLEKNVKVHRGEKQFACKLCTYKCFIKQSMTRHMISHTGEKPFLCEICDYKCSIKQYLKKHMKTHSSEKPFTCAICQFKCAHKDSLRSHLKVHTSKRRVLSIP